MHIAPDPNATWLRVSDQLDEWAELAAARPDATADFVAGIRDMLRNLSMDAPKPGRAPPT